MLGAADICFTRDLHYPYRVHYGSCWIEFMTIGATHLTSTITCTSFYVLSWPGRHFWRARGFHRVWRELTDVNSVVQSHITKCGHHEYWWAALTPKCVKYSRVVTTDRQIKQTPAATSTQFGRLNVPTRVFPSGSHVTGSPQYDYPLVKVLE